MGRDLRTFNIHQKTTNQSELTRIQFSYGSPQMMKSNFIFFVLHQITTFQNRPARLHIYFTHIISYELIVIHTPLILLKWHRFLANQLIPSLQLLWKFSTQCKSHRSSSRRLHEILIDLVEYSKLWLNRGSSVKSTTVLSKKTNILWKLTIKKWFNDVVSRLVLVFLS